MSTGRDPIAIVGMACRFAPDISSPDQLWDFLLAGSTAVGPVPDGRWDDYRNRDRETTQVLQSLPSGGCYLPDVAGFDAEFFGIPPREARLIDPQHRLCLELAWQALEHAGVPARALAGTDTGVFVGIGSDDYGRRLLEDLPRIEAWTGIGASPCGAANRVSHALDLRGPSVAVDTACSSSLVAVHQAMQALWLDEVPVALAGGVMLMTGPGLSVVLAQAGATSPDGCSKPFAASADGYGRGEGGAMVVLKRLPDARRDGDRVLAVLRGGAVRQDGRTDGIMAPSGAAQEQLLRAAYRSTGVDPRTVGYVEAHGTGTVAGDPQEAAALAAVFGPCAIGSLKGNIGHLEAASGVAGLMKVVLGLRHSVLPPTRMPGGPSPAIDWAGTGLAVVTEPRPWPGESARPRRAGVSGYGYGGTIAHLVLEEAPAQAAEPGVSAHGPLIFPLSAAHAETLTAQASALIGGLGERSLTDVAHTLARRRSHLRHRDAVVATTRAELVDGLSTVESVDPVGDPVWVFSGHGQQWPGMGRELLVSTPAFAAAMDHLGPVFDTELGHSAWDLLLHCDLGRVEFAQAAIFAVQIGLAEVWRCWGVRPAAVIGHSVGEIAAAVTAGALSTSDGARLACRRALLLAETAGHGAMVMVALPFADAERFLGAGPGADSGADQAVCAAIMSSPHTTVLSGTVAAVRRVRERLAHNGIAVREVDSDVAFHSPQMDPLRERLSKAADGLTVRDPQVPLYSTALADPRDPSPRDGDYWAVNLRAPVLLAGAVAAAVADGHRGFLEVSAHPVVAHSITETAPEAVVTACLRRGAPQQRALLTALAQLYRDGVDPDWRAVQPGGDLTDLPSTVWRRTRLWADAPDRPHTGAGPEHDPAGHTLLGGTPWTVVGCSPATYWRTRLSHATRPYPGEHPVAGSEIVPAAVLLTTFLAATGSSALADVVLRVPVTTTPDRDVQVVAQDGTVRVSSATGGDGAAVDWLTHATARSHRGSVLGLSEIDPRGRGDRVNPRFVLDRLAEVGVAAMGFDWTVDDLRRTAQGLWARVSVPDAEWAPLLDAALSTAAVALLGPPSLRMPARIGEVLVGEPITSAVVEIAVTGPETVQVTIADLAGRPIGGLRALRFGAPEPDRGATGPLVYRIGWQPVTPARTACADAVVVQPRTRPGETVTGAAARMSAELITAMSRPVWCVTHGVREARGPEAVAQAALWGIGRIAAAERPEHWCGVVDVPGRPTDADLAALDRLTGTRPDGEDVFAIEGGEVLATRLTPQPPGPGLTCAPDGTYLITGGSGALAGPVAHWLVDRGARRLLLLSRHAVARVTNPLIGELEARGVTVRALAADVADPAALAAVDTDALGLPPVRGIVHAAGITENRFLGELDEASIARVLRPKADGALALHQRFPPGSLDFFVLFSSAGQLLHLPGQGAYAAANAMLDALARQRRAAGETGSIAVAWTSWRGLGMSTSSAAIDAELAAQGTGDITAPDALRAWGRIGQDAPANVAVLRVLPNAAVPPMLADVAPSAATTLTDWMSLPDADRLDFLTDAVRTVAANTLGAATVDTGAVLAELGLDSLLSAALRRDLAALLGIRLPPTLLWHHPTVTAIACHLCRERET